MYGTSELGVYGIYVSLDSIGTSGNRCPSVGTFESSDSISAWRCQVPVESADVRVPKGANLYLWIFGFSVPSEIRYPLVGAVGALGSSDSIGAWRCRVPMESEDAGVPSVSWGFMRVVWFFRFSA